MSDIFPTFNVLEQPTKLKGTRNKNSLGQKKKTPLNNTLKRRLIAISLLGESLPT